MGCASFLDHQRRLAEGNGRSNCQTLFGIQKILTDPHIRSVLDGVPTAAFDPLFYKAIETDGVLDSYKRLDNRVLSSLDGTEHFCSRCSSQKGSDGGIEYFHSLLGASIVAPGHQQVPPPPEFIAPQDGAKKQDYERNVAKRWLGRHGAVAKSHRPLFLGDDLFVCQPVAAAIQRAGGNFIRICKPSRIGPSPNIGTAPLWRSTGQRPSRPERAVRPRFTAGFPEFRYVTQMTHWR